MGFLPQTKCSGHDFSRTEARDQGQGHSDPKTVCDIPGFLQKFYDKFEVKSEHVLISGHSLCCKQVTQFPFNVIV